MSAQTEIQWTDRTWNPVRGCSVISPGCVNCYAMKQAHRFSGPGKAYEGLTKLTKAGPQWTGQIRTVESALLEPLSWRKPARVFVNSMSDLFHDGVSYDFLVRVFATMQQAHRHTFQILTKRADRMREVVSRPSFHSDVSGCAGIAPIPWPLRNVWLGVSVEDQQRADGRIPLLLQTPAAVRFVSAEPLLGPVDFTHVDYTERCRATMREFSLWQGDSEAEIEEAVASITGPSVIDALRGRWDDGEDSGDYERKLDWIIVGGESGHGARPFDLAWGRSIVQQCRTAGVACFVKQLGAKPLERFTRRPEDPRHVHGWTAIRDNVGDGSDQWYRYLPLLDRKGGDMSEWPAYLRVREFPLVAP